MESKTKAPHPRYIYDDDNMMTSFGLSYLKKEEAPMNPDELTWEHPPGSGCEKCQRRYDKQLKAYKEYNNQ